MPRMPSADRRRQLTEAAIRAMTRDGAARTTTRSIAAEAGVSLSVVHYCFDSKAELLEAVIEAITAHSVALVREAIRRRPTLHETVRAGFQAYWDHVCAQPGEHMLTYELTQYALRRPGLEHLAHRQYTRYQETYEELIVQLSGAMGLVPRLPVPVLARYLAAMTDGLTLSALALGETRTPHDPARARAGAPVLDLMTDQVTALLGR
ncbi:TetR family transcriptional regulator [Streptomyces sp. 3211.6]|uniref:TetR/AcrR family transcriptional regulator n=1 Tax=Streptomyces TaxID=1883 RepID=UPI0009A4EB96|nr:MULTISPECIES: TetR/AcrR family transcriptional regulator [Streptomyces]RKT03405.1 TetR family transcriptional regulator [Streptomyces sp. 3211.6]RPF25258.1 TetR family transcriptional regulator [Streptomyces sp. Ag109_G2-6]